MMQHRTVLMEAGDGEVKALAWDCDSIAAMTENSFISLTDPTRLDVIRITRETGYSSKVVYEASPTQLLQRIVGFPGNGNDINGFVAANDSTGGCNHALILIDPVSMRVVAQQQVEHQITSL